MSNYLTVKAGKTVGLLARVTDADGTAIDPDDVSAAVYSIVELDDGDWSEGDAVTGHDAVSLTPADILFDELQTGNGWTTDDRGFNLRVEPDGGTNAPFPDPATTYLVRVTLAHATLGSIVVEFYVSTLRELSAALCSRRDLEEVFGSDNIVKWADVSSDGDQDKIMARIGWACSTATAYVYGRLRSGPYAIPFATPDPIVVDATARIAAAILYDARGAQAVDATTGAPENLLSPHRKRAELTLSKLIAGALVLSAEEVSASYPRVVRDRDGWRERSGRR